jgi:acyl-CoA thioester hydrolase
VFHHRIKVRYGEVDRQGVVFNAHWLTYFDDALTEFLAHVGHDPKHVAVTQEGLDVMLVHAELDWHGPVGIGDILDIEVLPVRLGRSSFDLRFTARVGDTECVSATLTYVSVDPVTHRSAPVPDDVRNRFRSAIPA